MTVEENVESDQPNDAPVEERTSDTGGEEEGVESDDPVAEDDQMDDTGLAPDLDAFLEDGGLFTELCEYAKKNVPRLVRECELDEDCSLVLAIMQYFYVKGFSRTIHEETMDRFIEAVKLGMVVMTVSPAA